MLKRLAASALAVCCVMPAVCAAQNELPERYGSCWVISVPMRTFWRSSVFEHPIRYGELGSEMQRVPKEFLSAVRVGWPSLPADEAAYCTFLASRAEVEANRTEMSKTFRTSKVDFVEVPWQPSDAPPMASSPMPSSDPVVAKPAPAALLQPAAPRTDTGDIESDYWSRIVDSRVAEDFDDYLKAFPEGRHAPLARLEAKRLRRGAAPTAAAPVARAAIVRADVGAGAQVDPAFPIDDAVRATLADVSFRIPAGHGVVVEHAGKRINTVGTVNVPVAMDSKLRRETGDVCRLELRSIAGEADSSFDSRSQGLTWAGLLPLALTSRMSSKYAIIDSTYRANAVSHQGGALFPLVEGAVHVFSEDAASIDKSGKETALKMDMNCRVGTTGAAALVIAGMAGEQTELQCKVTYPSFPTLGAQDQIFHWFTEAGCFVQDPNRP